MGSERTTAVRVDLVLAEGDVARVVRVREEPQWTFVHVQHHNGDWSVHSAPNGFLGDYQADAHLAGRPPTRARRMPNPWMHVAKCVLAEPDVSAQGGGLVHHRREEPQLVTTSSLRPVMLAVHAAAEEGTPGRPADWRASAIAELNNVLSPLVGLVSLAKNVDVEGADGAIADAEAALPRIRELLARLR